MRRRSSLVSMGSLRLGTVTFVAHAAANARTFAARKEYARRHRDFRPLDSEPRGRRVFIFPRSCTSPSCPSTHAYQVKATPSRWCRSNSSLPSHSWEKVGGLHSQDALIHARLASTR